jgi:hypothetical protein
MWRVAATGHNVDNRNDDIARNAATANLDHNTNDEHTIHAIAMRSIEFEGTRLRILLNITV